jgi:hypothetical protein
VKLLARALVSLALLAGCGASPAPAGPAPVAETPLAKSVETNPTVIPADGWEPMELFPEGQGPIPGKVTGVLWLRGLFDDPAPPKPPVYVFSFDGRPSMEVLFLDEISGTAHYAGKGRGANGGDSDEVRALSPGDSNPHSLSAKTHLVELEISRGKGYDQHSTSIIATGVRIEDNLSAAPIEPLLSGARALFEKTLNDQGHGELLTSPHTLRAHPTWLRDEKAFKIRFFLQATPPGARVKSCAPCAPDNDQCPCSVEAKAVAASYRFNTAGKLVEHILYAPRDWGVSVAGGKIDCFTSPCN